MKTSWQTTTAGIMTALGLAFATDSNPTICIIAKVFSVGGMAWLGAAARDNNRSSEDVGIIVTPPSVSPAK